MTRLYLRASKEY